jgi:hypothetical protein
LGPPGRTALRGLCWPTCSSRQLRAAGQVHTHPAVTDNTFWSSVCT